MARKKPANASGTAKGRIVEAIAAWLHDFPNVKVERNVRLPAKGDPTRYREVDVLLTTSAAGYAVRIAIGCKNEAKPLPLACVGEFLDILGDVGIPRQHGILVSASGYEKNALRRARKAGIRALELKGLSSDGLCAAITSAAYQYVVFLVGAATEVTFFATNAEPLPPLLFVDRAGKLCGTVPHLVARRWNEWPMPIPLGEHTLTLPIPAGWYPFAHTGVRVNLLKREIYAKISVRAMVHTFDGRSEHFALVNAREDRLEKLGTRVFFDTPEGQYPLTSFETDVAYNAFVTSREGIRVTNWVKVPRVIFNTVYWPMSRAASQRIGAVIEAQPGAKEITLTTEAVEGLDIGAAWEPPMSMEELDQLFLTPVRARGIRPEDAAVPLTT
jgi:hypothetical protein